MPGPRAPQVRDANGELFYYKVVDGVLYAKRHVSSAWVRPRVQLTVKR